MIGEFKKCKPHADYAKMTLEEGQQQHQRMSISMLRKIASTHEISTYIHALGDSVLVALMLNAEIPFDNDIVCIACAFGYTDDVRQFLAHGADVAAENYRSLQLAIENGSTEIVRLFLELPFDPSVALFKSLNIAIQRGFTEIIRLLLETRGCLCWSG